ncbi:MAG: hypothetical protein ACOC0N_10470 [Chroococcales cyanobacterium]
MDAFAILIQAASENPPPSQTVVNALLAAEKAARQDKPTYPFDSLVGTWRLRFITGTKKTRQRAGVVLGAGRYLPRWVKISLSYSRQEKSIPDANVESGRVENSVQLGGLKMTLTGPVKFLFGKNLLAFDFTSIQVQLFGMKVYQGSLRGGKEAEEKFYSDRIAQQAFFSYFWVTETAIAARGRGGGLALWTKA